MPNYNTELLVQAPPRRLYQALTTQAGLQGWWTESCTIGDGVGARSTFYFGETWKIMRTASLKPDTEVRWTCTDSHIAAPGLKRSDEWIGTDIVFRLVPRGEQTLLQFEHVGLTPQIECYALCTSGWHQFLGSLKKYAETGKGAPYVEA
ncbi:MAG TPA: SRPBCC domain-containing protein [Rhodocyclaceae bacterium]|nr:SRPBCC domain-containing protein [Rhodocyclaceae bacterium]